MPLGDLPRLGETLVRRPYKHTEGERYIVLRKKHKEKKTGKESNGVKGWSTLIHLGLFQSQGRQVVFGHG